jgi:hypothetical protein
MCFEMFLLAVESRDLSQADKSVIRVSSFPSSRTSFSVYQQLRPKLSARWILSILSDLPLTRKTRQVFTFSFEWWNWPKHQSAKCQIVVFSITVSFIVKKLKFCKIEKEDTLITLLSAWDRSRDSTAKRNLSKHMWRSIAMHK